MRYYGNKTKLLPFIESSIERQHLKKTATFVDLFAGTCSVGKYFKRQRYKVISNDLLEFSHAMAKTYIELNETPAFTKLLDLLHLRNVDEIINFLNTCGTNFQGFMYEHYCPHGGRQYFSDTNALRIDTIRQLLHDWRAQNIINEAEFYYLLTSLLEAINLVSNVSGTYAAFLKKWDNRALKPLTLQRVQIIHGVEGCLALRQDANELINNLQADVLYLDPPYNTRQYTSNYFILELVAQGWFDDLPTIHGVCGQCNFDHLKSDYAVTARAQNALQDLIEKINNVECVLLSYNNEGIIPISNIETIMREKGDLTIFKQAHKRYRSINQTEASPKQTTEYIFRVNL